MQLILDEDQQMIAQTALDFVDEHSPVARFRELRDSGAALGYSRDLQRELLVQARIMEEHMGVPVVHAGSVLPVLEGDARCSTF